MLKTSTPRWLRIALIIFVTVVIWLLGFMIYRLLNSQKEETAYWRNKAFKTDTVRINTSYEKHSMTQPLYREAVPPKVIIQYQPYIPDNILQFRDSVLLVVDSLKKVTTTISPLFLQRYPEANKLIKATFKKDSLNLDLLDIKGIISTQQYKVDYSQFNYQYINNSLRGEELITTLNDNKPKKKSIIRYDGTYLYYDRDLLQSEHQVGATVGFDIWKLRIQGWSQYKLSGQAKLNGGVRAGYRLF